jgi:hypothetical protein
MSPEEKRTALEEVLKMQQTIDTAAKIAGALAKAGTQFAAAGVKDVPFLGESLSKAFSGFGDALEYTAKVAIFDTAGYFISNADQTKSGLVPMWINGNRANTALIKAAVNAWANLIPLTGFGHIPGTVDFINAVTAKALGLRLIAMVKTVEALEDLYKMLFGKIPILGEAFAGFFGFQQYREPVFRTQVIPLNSNPNGTKVNGIQIPPGGGGLLIEYSPDKMIVPVQKVYVPSNSGIAEFTFLGSNRSEDGLGTNKFINIDTADPEVINLQSAMKAYVGFLDVFNKQLAEAEQTINAKQAEANRVKQILQQTIPVSDGTNLTPPTKAQLDAIDLARAQVTKAEAELNMAKAEKTHAQQMIEKVKQLAPKVEPLNQMLTDKNIDQLAKGNMNKTITMADIKSAINQLYPNKTDFLAPLQQLAANLPAFDPYQGHKQLYDQWLSGKPQTQDERARIESQMMADQMNQPGGGMQLAR